MAVQRLRIYSSLIRSAIWSGRALLLSTKVTTSDIFRAVFKTLSFSQPVQFMFAADKGTNPETAGRAAIENIYMYVTRSRLILAQNSKTKKRQWEPWHEQRQLITGAYPKFLKRGTLTPKERFVLVSQTKVWRRNLTLKQSPIAAGQFS